ADAEVTPIHSLLYMPGRAEQSRPALTFCRPGYRVEASELVRALLDHHEGVVVVLGHLHVQIVVLTESLDGVPYLLEGLVPAFHLGIDLVCRVERGREDFLAEWTKLRSGRHQALQRGGVEPVISLKH